MTMAEQLYEVGRKLPPPALAELLDFAEFLHQKNIPPKLTPHMPLANWEAGWKTPQPLQDLPLRYRKKCVVNGIDYLLNTNFILGLLKSSPETLVSRHARIVARKTVGFFRRARREEAA